eukprot:GHVN01065074.1.p1 GENE.GHVN01065074.1~~GHVN01065074.1.p1  ORF type:complete len:128 (+),score=24.87 GHVN01065074.1:742-1125(+)
MRISSSTSIEDIKARFKPMDVSEVTPSPGQKGKFGVKVSLNADDHEKYKSDHCGGHPLGSKEARTAARTSRPAVTAGWVCEPGAQSTRDGGWYFTWNFDGPYETLDEQKESVKFYFKDYQEKIEWLE